MIVKEVVHDQIENLGPLEVNGVRATPASSGTSYRIRTGDLRADNALLSPLSESVSDLDGNAAMLASCGRLARYDSE